MYSYATGDMFCGTLDVTGRPAGRGVLYYFTTGECDVGVFDQQLRQTGEGVRYTQDRDAAYRLIDGELEGSQLDLEEALRIMELEETPAVRTRDTIPNPTTYDPAAAQVYQGMVRVPPARRAAAQREPARREPAHPALEERRALSE
eukprot:CAMPEP_0195099626 /NCGR_PEP_ID=MMETSP0448-20130528/58691_1 /TAXON_ID=66468 /ORGANISM="Heterocapsa triquestra, Strain CCMP 448" /LENGTH=145 /DNA_ID=CAMNT_0040134557 /DNA_START=21 /DNA_END=454 /DNA_ORIENTATION=+